MTDLETLIAKLEAATEGSLELDVLIFEVFLSIGSLGTYGALHYTTSLDAALALVPERWRVRELSQWDDCGYPGGWACCLECWKSDKDKVYIKQVSFGIPEESATKMPPTAPSPALAICIVALKARLP